MLVLRPVQAAPAGASRVPRRTAGHLRARLAAPAGPGRRGRSRRTRRVPPSDRAQPGRAAAGRHPAAEHRRLTAVKHLVLYGSNLVRIPPEIGAMSSLEEFTPYTSYRLHWFPYEITRCRKLSRSTVSTRALFGNYKLRPPFPRLQLLRAPPRTLDLGTWTLGAGAPRHPQLQRLRPPGRSRGDSDRCGFRWRCHRRTPSAGQRLFDGMCHRTTCRLPATTSLHRTRRPGRIAGVRLGLPLSTLAARCSSDDGSARKRLRHGMSGGGLPPSMGTT